LAEQDPAAGCARRAALHPLLDLSALPLPLRAVLYEPVRTGAFRSLYPIVPWCAIVIVGFVVGRDAVRREQPASFWLLLSVFRWRCSAPSVSRVVTAMPIVRQCRQFRVLAVCQVPPDLAFLTWAFAATLLGLALVWRWTRSAVRRCCARSKSSGACHFFFYVVHFYVLGLVAAIVRTKFGLLETYLIWLALLVMMAAPCAWYYDKKRNRPNLVTRYF